MITFVLIALLMYDEPRSTVSVVVDNFPTEKACVEFAKNMKPIETPKFFGGTRNYTMVGFNCEQKFN